MAFIAVLYQGGPDVLFKKGYSFWIRRNWIWGSIHRGSQEQSEGETGVSHGQAKTGFK
jgi:hypothetical protein